MRFSPDRRQAIKVIAVSCLPLPSCGGGGSDGSGGAGDLVAGDVATSVPLVDNVIALDSFTSTNGLALEGRVAEKGGTARKHPAYATPMEVRDGRARIPSASEAHYLYGEVQPPGMGLDVEFSLHVNSNSGAFGVTARASADADSCYWLRYDNGTAAWQLRRVVDGSVRTLATYAQVLEERRSYQVAWRLRGPDQTVTIDGVERISIADDDWLERGHVGLRGRGSTTPTAGYAIDDLRVRRPLGVRSCWSGGCTDSTAIVAVGLADRLPMRLSVSQTADMANALHSSALQAPAGAQAMKFTATGLTPLTRYHYVVELVDGGLVHTLARGQFRTLPKPGQPASFMFAHASCARTASNQRVFDAIRKRDPVFFVHQGDLHYEDITANDTNAFRAAYHAVLDSPRQFAMFSSVPVVYRFGDHDSCGEVSSRLSPNWPAVHEAYREQVPHYPLAGPSAPIYQAFTAGRVRFIILDVYTARDPHEAPLSRTKTSLGSVQKAWLKRELVDAVAVHGCKLIVLDVCNPWVGDVTLTSDRWGAYPDERAEIHDFIKANGLVGKVVMIAGDMHATAYDDGTNSDYATGGGAPVVVYQAAPLDREPSIKGGPYSSGTPIEHNGQYATFSVTDTGGATLSWTWKAYWVDHGSDTQVEILSHRGVTPA